MRLGPHGGTAARQARRERGLELPVVVSWTQETGQAEVRGGQDVPADLPRGIRRQQALTQTHPLPEPRLQLRVRMDAPCITEFADAIGALAQVIPQSKTRGMVLQGRFLLRQCLAGSGSVALAMIASRSRSWPSQPHRFEVMHSSMPLRISCRYVCRVVMNLASARTDSPLRPILRLDSVPASASRVTGGIANPAFRRGGGSHVFDRRQAQDLTLHRTSVGAVGEPDPPRLPGSSISGARSRYAARRPR